MTNQQTIAKPARNAQQLALAGVVQGRPQRVPGRKRTVRPKPAPSFAPHACVILAIDPGRVSGWAILERGVLVVLDGRPAVGSLRDDDARGRSSVVELAMSRAASVGLPLMVVAEKWLMHGMSHDSFAGLAASWGRWDDTLASWHVARSHVVRVYTQTWRARVLGGRNEAGGTPWKDRARAWAQHAHGVDVGPDEAEAIAIGAWGARAGEVLEKMPRGRG
ncbi:hypothetical protein L6R52_43080 [Myxococcota bacterium]|nr:hypothetical protein [Myxococcota bacterium]MCK6585945.1 hypothetical protein [Polyangiaceae bacterium]